MLKSINLSLSSACGADCIYCPKIRAKRIRQKLMPFDITKGIIDEISSVEFKSHHYIQKIELGENGDAFLNKEFIKILRHIKQELPEVKTELYNNFQYFYKEEAEVILKEGLVDSFHVNIDGSNESNYYMVKKLDLGNTDRNLTNFLEIRNRLNSDASLTVHILTLHNYINTIYQNFGFLPSKLNGPSLLNIPDDFETIKKQILYRLDKKKDMIVKSSTFAWSERKKIDVESLDYSKYVCPLLNRIENEAFITPNGTWYACCYDSNNELVLGNVINQSIDEISNSNKRKEFIQLLKDKKFAEIGGPCKTVVCCQRYGSAEIWPQKRKIINNLMRKLKRIISG